MTEEEFSRQVYELVGAINDTLNDHQTGILQVKVEALAYVTMWLLMNMGGQEHFPGLMRRFIASVLSFAENCIEILSPKSIRWGEVDQKAFGPIRETVEGLIENALGVTADQLLREKAA